MSDDSSLAQARLDMLNAGLSGGGLCRPFLDLVPVNGVSISILAGTLGQWTVCASDATAASLDELQFDLGEGPCWEALSLRAPALHPGIRGGRGTAWPVFADALLSRESMTAVESVFAFPLAIGGLDIGAVDLYSSERMPLTSADVASVCDLAVVASWQVLRMVLGGESPDGGPHSGQTSRREVHQATGMVLAQLSITADEAALLVRAHAYLAGRTVLEISQEIIDRTLVFTPDRTG